MTPQTLTTLRDVAVILLAIEALVLLVVALVAGRYAVQGMRGLLERMPGWLGVAREKVTAANRIAHRASEAAVDPLVRAEGAAAGLRAGVGAAARVLFGRKRA